MKNKLLFIALINSFVTVWAFNLFAQPVNKIINDAVMPAPTAAAFGKFVDIPVDYFTGVPTISIPIHTIEEGPLSMPISLDYHSSGLSIGEIASWVGAGWNLKAGGLITRTVMGLPDEIDNDIFGYYQYRGHYNNDYSDITYIGDGILDGEPDIFTFNFAGYTGKFLIDSAHVVNLMPKQDLKVNYSVGSDVFTRFIITTPDGAKYYFGNLPDDTSNDGIEVTRFQETALDVAVFPKRDVQSTWYLVRVESADAKWFLNLDYEAEKYSYTSLATCKYYGSQLSTQCSNASDFSVHFGTECEGSVDVGFNRNFNRVSMVGRRLSQITTSSGTQTVSFIATETRDDLDDTFVTWGYPNGTTRAKKLNEIRVDLRANCTK